MVLLKNKTKSGNTILPLDPDRTKKIVVIGALAASTQTGDAGSSNLKDPDIISPLVGLRSAGYGQTVIYHSGTDIATAVRAATLADTVVFVAGFTGSQEGESVISMDAEINDICLHGPVTGSWIVRKALGWLVWGVQRLGLPLGGDRQTLRLQPHDESLGSALAAVAGDNMVTVISASGTVILPEKLREQSAAILFSGYGGCRYGTALKDILFGQAEPSGRLSFVMPEYMEDLPDWKVFAEKVVYDRWWGYRQLQKNNKRPIWPFGFGLRYGQIKLIQGSLSCTDQFTENFFPVSVEVQNDGTITSSAVVQIYAGRDGHRGEDDYERVLVGFQKQLIQPGQVQKVVVRCRLNPVAHFNTTLKKLEIEAGRYVIYASQHEGDMRSETARVTCVDSFSI